MRTLEKTKSIILKTIGYIILLPMFYLTSCDPAIGYEYYIENNSNKELKVLFRGNGFRDTTETKLIFPQTEILLYDIEVWGRNPHDEKDDFLLALDTLNITAIDSSSILLEYLKRESWTYDNDIGHLGLIKTGTNIYTLKVSNQDFN